MKTVKEIIEVSILVLDGLMFLILHLFNFYTNIKVIVSILVLDGLMFLNSKNKIRQT